MTYYQITVDGVVIHDSRQLDPDLRVLNPTLNLHAGEAGSAFFRIHPKHPNYNSIQKLKSEISFWQDGEWLWSGRVLNDELTMDRQRRVEIEGELAYFNDSVCRPYDWVNKPIEGLLQKYIDDHNAQMQDPRKQFQLGIVEIPDIIADDPVLWRHSDLYKPTWEVMRDSFTESNLGGYFRVRRGANNERILDWVQTFGNVNDQVIRFGENIIDLNSHLKGADLVTAVIPLGSKISEDSDERITIAEINGGLDYVYNQEAVDRFGWIFKHVTHDGVTNLETLRDHGYLDLQRLAVLAAQIKLKAVDLNMIDVSVERIKLGDQIRVVSPPHDLDAMMMVTDLKIDLDNPANNTIELGAEDFTLTDITSNNAFTKKIETVLSNYSTNSAMHGAIDDAIVDVTANLTSQIEQTADEIMLQVSSEYVTTTQLGEEVEILNSRITQTDEEISFQFDQVRTDIDVVEGTVYEHYDELHTYINFDENGITLGKSDSPFIANLSNEELAFLQNGHKVAYVSNNKMYITDAEIRNNLALGTPSTGYFDFIPRANGNLSFRFREGVS